MGRNAKELYRNPISKIFFGRWYDSDGKKCRLSLNTKNEEEALERLPVVTWNKLSWNNCVKKNAEFGKDLIEKHLIKKAIFEKENWVNPVLIPVNKPDLLITRQEVIKAFRTTHVEEFSPLWKRRSWSFGTARNYIHKLGLKSQKEWRLYRKSGNKPLSIPSDPSQTYKTKGWVSWPDWLGTVYTICKTPRPFEEARLFARSKNFKNREDWKRFNKSGLRPSDIPAIPNKTYKDKGWVSWEDWLGCKPRVDYSNKKPFEEARVFVHSLGLKSLQDWQKWRRENSINIPSDPYKAYRHTGWVSWEDWLGKEKL